MKASRGMGIIKSSNKGMLKSSGVPKARTLTRKDGDKVKMYAGGGKVEKDFAGINAIMDRPRVKTEPKEAPIKRLPPSDENIVGKKPLVTGKACGGKVKRR